MALIEITGGIAQPPLDKTLLDFRIDRFINFPGIRNDRLPFRLRSNFTKEIDMPGIILHEGHFIMKREF